MPCDFPVRLAKPCLAAVSAILLAQASLMPGARAGDWAPTPEQRHWWAFQPVGNPKPPEVGGPATQELDRFVLARLEALSLTFARPADKATLLRRAKFALTGLPPTPEELEDFGQNASPDAFDQVVDRLLAGRHFGERWARHWLDVVRYTDYLSPHAEDAAETGDIELFEAFRYRDWVVDALNRDMPFNDFVTHQISGDQLRDPAGGEIHKDGLIATTLLAIGFWDNGDADKNKVVSDIVDDQINVVGHAFLGLTLACARCHDHKVDPVSTEDYYALAGIFYSTRVLEHVGSVGLHTRALRVPLATAGYVAAFTAQSKAIADIEARLKEAREAAGKEAPDAGTLSAEQVSALEADLDLKRKECLPAPDTALAALDGGTPGGPFPEIGDVPVHVAGKYSDLGEAKVPRRMPVFFAGEGQEPITNGSGRLELARWITDPRNPLTARVAVNRIWQRLFGEGLVRTTDNFGLLGEQPSHPELLDWLAAKFIESGWSTKAIIRTIMLSDAYRQGGEATPEALERDPGNRFISRAGARRLEAEVIRDSMLAVTGRLDPRPGGRAVQDFHAARRSLYIQTVRYDQRHFATLFDAADPTQCVSKRSTSTVAPQALFLLNDPFVREQCRHFAARLEREVPGSGAGDAFAPRLNRAWQLLYARFPTEAEAALARDLFDSARERRAPTAWEELLHVLFCANEFVYID